MAWSTVPIHSASLLANTPAYHTYVKALHSIEQVQRDKLTFYLSAFRKTAFGKSSGLSKVVNYEDFKNAVPITTYKDWESLVQTAQSGEKNVFFPGICNRFEPTSGSTSKRKWIPYTPALLKEFDQAASAWLLDLSLQHPTAYLGRHYWSLSWLPNDLRESASTMDDADIFPIWKRLLMKQIWAVPTEVARLQSLDESVFATLVYLSAASDLSLFSAWSPTFILEMLRSLKKHRSRVSEVLRSGQWPRESSQFEQFHLSAPKNRRAAEILDAWDGSDFASLVRELWPKLKVISSWDSSTAGQWAKEVRSVFQHAEFQAKGLWATEGVVTIPFQGRFPLALTSHFYEFKCLDTGKIVPSWELVSGQKVQPILTTGSGFLRYQMEDSLTVTGFLGTCPCFHFDGRLNSVDLVGEKIDAAAAAELLRQISEMHVCKGVTLVAHRGGPEELPGYFLLIQGDRHKTDAIREKVEEILMEFHHYRLARELGQLRKAGVWLHENLEDALDRYHEIRKSHGLSGGTKIEPLVLWEGERPVRAGSE